MSQAAATSSFQTANPHALATILEASETKSIIASSDIFDIRGIKLWARNQPVSRELQQKLMDRALSKPLETCLMAEDGITADTLRYAIQNLLETEDGALTPLLLKYGAALQRAAASIRLHPVVQLLLTAGQSARPQSFAHAVEGMALAGALMAARGGDTHLVTEAMTAGLVHDVGEMYIAPEFGEAEAGESLDVDSYRQLVVHPHIGHLLISQLTDYPKDISRAVAEHHEHLDGSGYPHRISADLISPLGRLLSATEAALTALRAPGANLHHASVALRVVPGEFDEHLAGPLAAAARSVTPLVARRTVDELRAELIHLDAALEDAMGSLDTALPASPSANLQRAVGLTRYLLHKLRSGWNESGLWSPGAIGEAQVAEAEAVKDALRGRLFAIERVARLSAGELSSDEQDCLDGMCANLIKETT